MTDLVGPLALSALAFFVAAGSPGPATLAVAATSMQAGRRNGLKVGAGLAFGLAIWGGLVGLGLGKLIVEWLPVMTFLRVLGGIVLLYLAWKSARSAFRPEADDVSATTDGSYFLRGFLLNMLNPKAALAWAATLVLGMPADASVTYLITNIAICSLLGLSIYTSYALFFSLPRVQHAYRRARRWLETGFAIFFGWAGLRLLFKQVHA